MELVGVSSSLCFRFLFLITYLRGCEMYYLYFKISVANLSGYGLFKRILMRVDTFVSRKNRDTCFKMEVVFQYLIMFLGRFAFFTG
jgi:hypothetical protein